MDKQTETQQCPMDVYMLFQYNYITHLVILLVVLLLASSIVTDLTPDITVTIIFDDIAT